jgi:putative membrane protein
MSKLPLEPSLRRLRHLPTALALGALLGACSSQPKVPAGARPAPPNMTMTAGNMAAVVRTYNVDEVRAANLALSKSKNPAVRAYAERMIHDHSAAEQQLNTVMAQLGTQPTPNTASQQDQARDNAAIASLQSKSGADFDRSYMDIMIAGHRALIQDLDTMIPGAREEAMKSYLTSLRTVAASHLQQAQQVRSSLGG